MANQDSDETSFIKDFALNIPGSVVFGAATEHAVATGDELLHAVIKKGNVATLIILEGPEITAAPTPEETSSLCGSRVLARRIAPTVGYRRSSQMRIYDLPLHTRSRNGIA